MRILRRILRALMRVHRNQINSVEEKQDPWMSALAAHLPKPNPRYISTSALRRKILFESFSSNANCRQSPIYLRIVPVSCTLPHFA